MADRRAHREQLQPDRPESHAGLLPQLSTALGARSASGLVHRRASPPVPDQSRGPGPGPLVRDRSAATTSADRRNPGRPGDPQRLNTVRQPGSAERGTFRAHRHSVDGPVRLARDASTATASPGGRLRPDACGGRTEGVCPPRTRYASLHRAGTGMLRRWPGRRCDRAATRPARPIKAAGRHMARQPGSEGLKAGAVRAAIPGPYGQLFTMPPGRTTTG